MKEKQRKKLEIEIGFYRLISKLINLCALIVILAVLGAIFYVNGYNYIIANHPELVKMELNYGLIIIILIIALTLFTFIKCNTLVLLVKLKERLKILEKQ